MIDFNRIRRVAVGKVYIHVRGTNCAGFGRGQGNASRWTKGLTKLHRCINASVMNGNAIFTVSIIAEYAGGIAVQKITCRIIQTILRSGKVGSIHFKRNSRTVGTYCLHGCVNGWN